MKIAFFDFDGTLTRHDSFIRFAIFCVGRSGFLKAFLHTVPDLVRWKLGLIDASEAKEHLFSCLYRGMPYVRFMEFGEAFTTHIDKAVRQQIIAIKDRHIRDGHEIIIVTASVSDWVRPWAGKNGIGRVIATEVEVDSSGNLTGRFATPNCNGKEKVERIRRLFPNISEYETWAYGNSSGDDAMLSLADHSRKV